MAITPLPDAPLPTDSTAGFNSKAFALVASLDGFVTETNATAVAVTASQTSASTSASTATTKANEASASALNALNSQTLALSSAITATGQATASSQSATSASNFAITATSQASLAEGYALSASSVVQQDLSGVTATALHRSPNAITAMFVYDTSKDSDGGAWTEKCQGTSWYNEDINGTWLGACGTEVWARTVNATLSSELVTNATFSSASNWVVTGDWSIDTENGWAIRNGGTGNLYQQVNVTSGKLYKIQIYVKDMTTYLDRAALDTNLNSYNLIVGTPPTSVSMTTDGFGYEFYFVPTTSNGYINIYGSAFRGKITKISVREVTAQTTETGDYFQLTTDGKFYKLNATSGTTEVFRGNKRDFPRLAGIVAEAASVTIYDLTEPNRPMWMRAIPLTGLGASFSAVNGLNGRVCAFGGNAGHIFNFLEDAIYALTNALKYVQSFIATRNTTKLNVTSAYSGGYFNGTNSISMYAFKDSAFDSYGLKIPSIAFTATGQLDLIKENGSIVGSSAFDSLVTANLSENIISAVKTGAVGFFYALNPKSLNPNFTLQSFSTIPDFAKTSSLKLVETKDSVYVRSASGPTATLLKNNETTANKGTASTITNLFNTGYQTGDIRRTYLSDIGAGSVTGQDVITGDDSTFTTSIGNWLVSTNEPDVTISRVADCLRIAGPPYAHAYLTMTGLVIGRTYFFSGRTVNASLNRQVLITATNPNTLPAYSINPVTFNADGAANKISGEFTATATTMYVRLGSYPAVGYTDWDDIRVYVRQADRSYKDASSQTYGTLTKSLVATNTDLVAYSGFSASNYAREPYSADLDFGVGEWSCGAWVNVPAANATANTILCREHSSGAYIRLGLDATNKLTATAFDGTTTRTVTTTAAYNTATWLKAEADYTTDGTLAISVNGVEVATTRGNPLLTLNNANAVLTIGNSYATDAPFAGSIALLKLSATVPTAEQSVWMYEQEKQLFRENAKCVLPDSGAIVDLSYDNATDKWISVSATNRAEFTGLVRTGVTASPTGSYTKVSATSGVQLQARSTTSPGVDVTIPPYGLREELINRSEAASRLNADLVTFDYVGGFTASTTNGNTAITSVASLTYPTSYIGAQVTGSGIPASTVIVAVSGTTIYLSKATTATATGVQISFTDFILPVGYEEKTVLSAGASKVEGATKDFTKLFDGFKETVRFGTAPGFNVAVQIQASRSK